MSVNRRPTPLRPLSADEVADHFELLVVTQQDDVVVSVRGEIDVGTAPLLWDALEEAIRTAPPRVVIDLHDTAFVDSAALTIFARAFKRLRHQGAELVLRSPRANARKVLQISGLDQLLTIET